RPRAATAAPRPRDPARIALPVRGRERPRCAGGGVARGRSGFAAAVDRGTVADRVGARACHLRSGNAARPDSRPSQPADRGTVRGSFPGLSSEPLLRGAGRVCLGGERPGRRHTLGAFASRASARTPRTGAGLRGSRPRSCSRGARLDRDLSENRLEKTRGQTLAGRPPAVADLIAEEEEEEDPGLRLLRRNKVKALQLRLEYHIFAKHFCRKCKNYTSWRFFPGWWRPEACLQPRASWDSPLRWSAGGLQPSKRGWAYACFIAPRAACGSPTKGRAISTPAPASSPKSRKPTPPWARAASSRKAPSKSPSRRPSETGTSRR